MAITINRYKDHDILSNQDSMASIWLLFFFRGSHFFPGKKRVENMYIKDKTILPGLVSVYDVCDMSSS